MTSLLASGKTGPVDLGARISALLKAKGWTQARLAAEAEVSEEALSKIITGTTADPLHSSITRIAHALGETVGSLLGEKGFDLTAADQQFVRELIAWANRKLDAATQPLIDSAPNATELEVISDSRPAKSPNAAAIPGLLRRKGAKKVFRASGDSMIAAGILADDLLFVRDAGVLRMAAGKIVVCRARDKTYVKTLEMERGHIRLVSADERYAPIELTRDEVQFIGVVIGRMGSFVS